VRLGVDEGQEYRREDRRGQERRERDVGLKFLSHSNNTETYCINTKRACICMRRS
jgi:hypothetical protein